MGLIINKFVEVLKMFKEVLHYIRDLELNQLL